MADCDYAAPLKQERRKSVWASITRSLHLTTDWNSAPPLTAVLREKVPNLLQYGTSIQNSLLEASATDAIRLCHPIVVSDNLRQPHTNSGQEANAHGTHQRSLTACSHQQTARCGLNRQSPLEYASPQEGICRPLIQSEQTPPRLPSIRSHSPLWNVHLYGDPQSAPAPSTVTTVPQVQQKRNACQTLCHHNVHGRIVPTPRVNRPSLTCSICRRPVQSSQRNQADKSDIAETKNQSRRSQSANPVIHTSHTSDGCSHFPDYSLLLCTKSRDPPSPISCSSSAARHIHSHNQSQTSSLRDANVRPRLSTSSPTHVELQAGFSSSPNTADLPGGFEYNSPDFPRIPLLPGAAFAQRSGAVDEGSTTNLTTFESSNPPSRPLNLLESNIVGLKQHVKSGLGIRQSWKAKTIHFGQRIKYHTRLLWDSEDDRVKMFHARCDVWAFGPLHDCMCGVCVRKRGENPATADRVAHEVPYDSA